MEAIKCKTIDCEEPRIKGYLYCTKCKKVVIKQLEQTGYLRQVPVFHTGVARTKEQREDTRETKWGSDR